MILSCPRFSSLCFDFMTPLSVCYVGLSLHYCLLFLFFRPPFLTVSLSCPHYSLSSFHSPYHYVTPQPSPTTPPPVFHHCFIPPLPLSDIRLRVRAEYLEHESALREGVSSDKQQPLERQFELFSQANSLLRARDLGSIVCDIKFTELDNLEAFWSDYLSGDLLEALKGVFITDSLRMAAGTEGVRLLISVDQDDYEEGRRLLSEAFGPRRRMLSSNNGGRTETHWAV